MEKGTVRNREKKETKVNVKNEKEHIVTSFLINATQNCLLFPFCIYTLIISSTMGYTSLPIAEKVHQMWNL